MADHPKDPDDFLLKRRRTDKHLKNCNKGYRPKSAGRIDSSYCQVHHQLPVSSLQDASIKEVVPNDADFKVIYNCLANTDWDIDVADNLVGLPLKRAFVAKGAPKVGLWDWPCHMYGHNQYTKEVKTRLKEQVWDIAQEKAEDCDVEYAEIAGELTAAAEFWHDWLVSRGTDNGGTEICWKERRHRKQWWVPFSMDPGDPAEVRPPPTLEEFAANMQEALAKLFKTL